MAGNSKSFNLISITRKSFNLIINNFDFVFTLLFRLREHVRIEFLSKAIVNATQSLRVKKISIVSLMKMISKNYPVIRVKKIKMLLSMRLAILFDFLMNENISLNIITTIGQRLVLPLTIKKIGISADPTLAEFYTLGQYDPDTLGTMDLLTLGELDYTLS